MLYSWRHHRQEVQPNIDWDIHACFKRLLLWWDRDKPQQKLCFLTHGLRLLLNDSQPESCVTDSQEPSGYPATSGEWIALTLELQALRSCKESGRTSVMEKNRNTRLGGAGSSIRKVPCSDGPNTLRTDSGKDLWKTWGWVPLAL